LPNKNNYVHNIKRKKVIFRPAVFTQVEIRKYIIYKKIILNRWKQRQDCLMLICMFQVKLKISNSCRCLMQKSSSRLPHLYRRMHFRVHHPHLWTYHTSNRVPICFSPCTWKLNVVAFFFFRGSKLLAYLIYQPIVSCNSHMWLFETLYFVMLVL
jgi:hypothetical protein